MDECDPLLAGLDRRTQDGRRDNQPGNNHARVLVGRQFRDDPMLGMILALEPALRQTDADLRQALECLRTGSVFKTDLGRPHPAFSCWWRPRRHRYRWSAATEPCTETTAIWDPVVLVLTQHRLQIDPPLAITLIGEASHRFGNGLVLVAVEQDFGDRDRHDPAP